MSSCDNFIASKMNTKSQKSSSLVEINNIFQLINSTQAIITIPLIKVHAAPMDPAVLANNIQALRAMNFPGVQMKSDINPTLAKLATLFFFGQLNPNTRKSKIGRSQQFILETSTGMLYVAIIQILR